MQAAEIVNKMMQNDAFSQWLGIKILDVSEGYCKLQMTTKKEMLNGFGILHGGITYALADSTLAFASNSKGKKAVSIATEISHLKKVKENEVLTAVSKTISSGKQIAVYQIEIFNENQDLVALFKGTVFSKTEDI